ncbi:hypothetical protein E2K93_09080 [Thalassotalea sp. HSM 43]|uniref:hypothetical protein n=1 Tax=Thalassotalea sp. HSM 43 TaxID=2552945 RepID=UPI00108016E2|nr:hypothetical protein [Thalassotalea sp. HSM 43]QBY04532.1 hypothetical protein E2K93_09080 [Thalassotalea sp. HSM 43]
MENSSWYQKPEMIIALSALMISLITAVVAIYSAYIDRSYARASMWPRVEIFRSYGGNNFSYGVTNSGNGPALINYAVVKHNGEIIKHWHDISDFSHFTQSHFGNKILSPQQIINPVKYNGDNAKLFLKADKTVEIELCYCSIYDECWLTSRINQPQEVANCSIEESHRFAQ